MLLEGTLILHGQHCGDVGDFSIT